MRFSYSILADAVSVNSDGKLHMLGAGFDGIGSAELPANVGTLVAVVQMWATPEEQHRPHSVHAEFLAPDGKSFAAAIDVDVKVRPHPRHPGREVAAGMILNLQNVVLNEWGEYTIRLSEGGEHIGDVKFDVYQRDAATDAAEAYLASV
jgi:hypothetical protein